MKVNNPAPPRASMLPESEEELDVLPTKTPERTPSTAPAPPGSLDFAADYAIPTLDSVANPGDEDEELLFTPPVLEPVLIGRNPENFNKAWSPPPAPLSQDDIQRITENLKASLIPEIEKAVGYAMNHAFAYAMDQATHVLRQKIRSKVDELLPKLVENAIKHPPKKT